MTAKPALTFAFQVAPTGAEDDVTLYREVVEDCHLGAELGFESAWLLEHHFSDYYPIPSPMLFMAHIAAQCPNLGLGASVLVLPWYNPIRLAEEIAMVRALSNGPLHLGLGRGTAKSEYDAYAVDMREARGRFAEGFDIIRQALSGKPVQYSGTYFSIPNPVRVRPTPDNKPIHFYGAIGSPASAEIMGKMGLPPLCLSTFPDGLLTRILEKWKTAAAASGHLTEPILPISVKLFLADSDREAEALGRRYYPYYFDLQARHYEVDAGHWDDIPDYAAFAKMFANLKVMADPEKVGPFMQANLVGCASKVIQRIEQLAALGFNYFLVSAAIPGVPKAVRHDQLRRFAEEVGPHVSAQFAPRPAVA